MKTIKTFQDFILEGVDLDHAKEQEVQAKIREDLKKLDKQLADSEDSTKSVKDKATFKAKITQSVAKLHTNLGASKAKESQLISKEVKTM